MVLCHCNKQVLLAYLTSTFQLWIEMSYHNWSNLCKIGHYGGSTAEHYICFCRVLTMEGISTTKIVWFHRSSTQLPIQENYVIVLPVSAVCQFLGLHDTLPCVLIYNTHISRPCPCVFVDWKARFRRSLSLLNWTLCAVTCKITEGQYSVCNLPQISLQGNM